MQYMGGKARVAKQISAVMLARTKHRKSYLEPFVGGGWVAAQMAPHFASARAGDIMPDVVLMWQAVQEGWRPPLHVSRGMWDALRYQQPSPDRAFAGFACSFGGKFFRGWVDDSREITSGSAAAGSRAIDKKRAAFADITLRNVDYAAWSVSSETLVYCDPPYVGTEPFPGVPAWDDERFWLTALKWVTDGADVYVSGYVAPDGWVPIWHKYTQSSMNRDNNSTKVVERLFVHESQAQ